MATLPDPLKSRGHRLQIVVSPAVLKRLQKVAKRDKIPSWSAAGRYALLVGLDSLEYRKGAA